MTTNANITAVNNIQDLEALVDGAVVLVDVQSPEWGNYPQPKAMLYEKVNGEWPSGEKSGYRFIEMLDSPSLKAVIWYDVYEDKGLSFNDGTIVLEKEKVKMSYKTQGQGGSTYTQKESQLRQAGLYHG